MEYFDLIYACNKVHTAEQLKALQAMPLDAKVEATKIRLIEFYNHFNGAVYISFSGGKDSTVLAYIANDMLGLNIPLVFSNTGLEYSEIQKFAKAKGAEFIRPEMQFTEVISTYGYPLISKEVAQSIYYARKAHQIGKTTRLSRSELSGKRTYSNGIHSRYNKEKWKPACDNLQFKISHICCSKVKKHPLDKFSKEHNRCRVVATMTDESARRKKAG